MTLKLLQAVGCFILTLIVTIAIGRVVIGLLYRYKIGQPLRYLGLPALMKLHENKKNTPTMGGVLMGIVFLLMSLFYFDWKTGVSWVILFVYIGFFSLGVFDDYQKLKGMQAKGISAKTKILLQLLISCAAFFLFYQLDPVYFKKLFPTIYHQVFKLAFFVFVVVGSSNAVNLTDGLDGLASGILAIVSLGLAGFSVMIHGDWVFTYSLILIGATSIGFLWYNCYPAQVFMGDTGSLSYGGVLGFIACLLDSPWVYALMGSVFVVEALSVMIQVVSFRYFKQKRVFLCTPIHHHFQYLNWSETKIVNRFWIVSLLTTGLSFVFYGWIYG